MKTIAQQLNVTEFPFKIKDKNGNEIYYENSTGYWQKREFDSNGNEIYFADSDGYWVKIDYDSNRTIMYYENSTGWWSKSEYDSNRNQIYFENSDGKIIDNRPKGCEGKVVEIDGEKYKLIKVN